MSTTTGEGALVIVPTYNERENIERMKKYHAGELDSHELNSMSREEKTKLSRMS